MNIKLNPTWKELLKPEFEKPYFKELVNFVKDEYKNQTIYPPGPYIFRALDESNFDDAKVVILGQDPYHGPGQANGLAFSVANGVRVPPSLQNIYKEIKSDLGLPIPETGNLERWAKQGVLLLNATLTVRARTAGSHQGKGWEEFTDAVIQTLNDKREHLVFMLWGKYAQVKGAVIDREKHLVLESPHPSPFSANRGFFGAKHFSKANDYLRKNKEQEINWS